MHNAQGLVEQVDCIAVQALGPHDPVSAIPPIPHAGSEQRIAVLLADLQQPVTGQQPFWRCARQLSSIAEINQLRGLPGARAAALGVRQRNIEVCLPPYACSFSWWGMLL